VAKLTTFSIANDVAKYFAILPAIFVAAYPGLGVLNIMGLASPTYAILSAVIFNALILVALVPLALRGVAYRPSSAGALLRRNLLIYGLGGLIVPFVGIKAIDAGPCRPEMRQWQRRGRCHHLTPVIRAVGLKRVFRSVLSRVTRWQGARRRWP
jgi:hypothetical protein